MTGISSIILLILISSCGVSAETQRFGIVVSGKPTTGVYGGGSVSPGGSGSAGVGKSTTGIAGLIVGGGGIAVGGAVGGGSGAAGGGSGSVGGSVSSGSSSTSGSSANTGGTIDGGSDSDGGSNIYVITNGSLPSGTNLALSGNIVVTQTASLGNVLAGTNSGGTATLNINTGVTLTVNQLNFVGGAINIGAGANLIINNGLAVTGTTPLVINIGSGANLNLNSITITKANSGAIGNLLIINGQGSLSLAGSSINIVNANLEIDVPVTIGPSTQVNIVGSSSIIIGGVLSITGPVNLPTNLVLSSGAIVAFQYPSARLTVQNANMMSGSTITASIGVNDASMLIVQGTLVSAASISVNGYSNVPVGAAIPIMTFASATGSVVDQPNDGFSLSVTSTSIIANRN